MARQTYRILLPLSTLRAMRDQMTEREHLARCRDAARRELRGSSYSPDDRADCASAILVAGLSETHGATPRRSDPRHSLTAYCHRAQNWRVSLQRSRERDHADALRAEDAAARDILGVLADADPLPEPTTADEAHAVARAVAARLGVAESAPAVDLLCRLARTDPSTRRPPTQAAYAAERGCSLAALKQRESRAERDLRSRYGDAATLLRTLHGEVNPAARIDPLDGSTVWLIGYADHSRAATTHGKTVAGRMISDLAADWRTGTDGGAYPRRPLDKADAQAVCTLRKVRTRKPRHGTPAERLQAEADALRQLGRALAHAAPTKERNIAPPAPTPSATH